MKIRIGDQIIDPEQQPVVIMFQDDNERLLVAGHLMGMAPKEGPRVYAVFPEEQQSTVTTEFLKESLNLAGYVQL